jgi:hypothetical protein
MCAFFDVNIASFRAKSYQSLGQQLGIYGSNGFATDVILQEPKFPHTHQLYDWFTDDIRYIIHAIPALL